MNLVSAAHYLKIGYRIRRACWEPEEFVSELANMLEKRYVGYTGIWNKQLKKFEEVRYVSSLADNYDPSLEDLLAEDWEVVTTGIRKYFNKKYGSLEYNDDTDWDNYVPRDDGEW